MKKKKHNQKKKKKNMKKRFKIDIDAVLTNILIVLLIIISVMSLIMLRDFIGYAGYEEFARGGTITEIDVYQIFPASAWNGIYGIALQAPIYRSWPVYTSNAGVDEVNPIFPCFEPGETHELFVTTLNESDIDWTNITAGRTELVDNYTLVTNGMSATNTFTDTISVKIGNNTIENVPATYMYQYGSSSSTDFPVGILEYDENIIMVAIINDLYVQGYRPDKVLNYEMMVPTPQNTTNLTYYIYIDPFDECPAGEGGNEDEVNRGSVHGWVTESEGGLFLENALVAIEQKIDITGTDGFYNITDIPVGDYKIVSLKTGLANYVGNVTIYEANSTEHNITMNIISEQVYTGTGPGVGTGVDDPGTKTKSGEGPGQGPGIGPYIERPEDIGVDYFISLDKLKKRLRIGEFFDENLLIFSFRDGTSSVTINAIGPAASILELSDSSVTIQENEYANISIRGFGLENGEYSGYIEIGGDFNGSLPVDIVVSDEERLPIEALLIDLKPLTRRPLPGKVFKFSVNLQNLLIDENYDVKLNYYIRGVEADTANNSMNLGNDTVTIRTTETIIKEVLIPNEWDKGDYFLIVEAEYFDQISTTSTIFEMFEPIHQYKVFGRVELWKILLVLGILALIIGTILYIRHRIESQKRFHAKVEYKLLPKKGPRSIYVGKIAETENDTYFDMDKLTVHSIVAGSTGGGKSIAGQVIIEECLMKDIAVIVFDPTAQWSGMLRKCQDEKMMSFYPRFHMTKKDARAFNGNVRAIKNPLEKVDLMKYWKPGEIQVITTSTLTPKQMDIFVANTVREVFKSNLQEYRGLRFMMVYDEVHRLLPKFGGSGEGFVQIERACREFRKWGIGVLLISQVLADFVGQIKANINTEVQMKTRDEGDLERIKNKYGPSFIQELVKSPVGSGMVQNSSWNRGQPYYVTFRPIMHSVKRLTDEELEQYNKYNSIVDDLEYQLEQLEAEGKDVFDLKLELKLSLDKIKQGGFNMVEIYLEGLKPRIEKIWKDLGKKPKHKELELVSQEELEKSVEQAEKDSAEAKAKEAADEKGEEEGKKALGLNDNVPPDQVLKLVNGTLVIQLKALLDEIKALKDDDFKKHVNEEKNDFSDWIRTAIGNDKWADLTDPIVTKEDYIKFLELLDEGKEKTFKPKTKREKPYSSKKAEPAKEEKEGEKKPEEKKAEGEKKTEEKKEEEKQGEAAVKSVEKPAAPATSTSPAPAQKPAAAPSAQPAQPAAPTTTAAAPSPSQQPAKPPAQTGLNWAEIKQKLAALQDHAGKINYLKEIESKNPDDVNLLLTIASEYHRNKDLANAEIYYKKSLQKNPDNPKVLFYLGSLYNSQKKYDEALGSFKKVLELQPDYPKVKEYIASIEKFKQTIANKNA